jgi:hypothetical protein
MINIHIRTVGVVQNGIILTPDTYEAARSHYLRPTITD